MYATAGASDPRYLLRFAGFRRVNRFRGRFGDRRRDGRLLAGHPSLSELRNRKGTGIN